MASNLKEERKMPSKVTGGILQGFREKSGKHQNKDQRGIQRFSPINRNHLEHETPSSLKKRGPEGRSEKMQGTSTSIREHPRQESNRCRSECQGKKRNSKPPTIRTEGGKRPGAEERGAREGGSVAKPRKKKTGCIQTGGRLTSWVTGFTQRCLIGTGGA